MSSDQGAMVNMSLSELIWEVPAFVVGNRLRTVQVTDSKSLYDCISAENPRVEDRRHIQHSAGLTKVDRDLQERMVSAAAGSAQRHQVMGQKKI